MAAAGSKACGKTAAAAAVRQAPFLPAPRQRLTTLNGHVFLHSQPPDGPAIHRNLASQCLTQKQKFPHTHRTQLQQKQSILVSMALAHHGHPRIFPRWMVICLLKGRLLECCMCAQESAQQLTSSRTEQTTETVERPQWQASCTSSSQGGQDPMWHSSGQAWLQERGRWHLRPHGSQPPTRPSGGTF